MADNKIYNQRKIRRAIDFSGLPHVGTCSPTDIDFAMEVGTEHKYLIGDFKERGKTLPAGQRIIFERHGIAFASIGYTVAVFLAWHEPEDDYPKAANAEVVELFILHPFETNIYWREVSGQCLLERYNRFFELGEKSKFDVLGEIGWNL